MTPRILLALSLIAALAGCGGLSNSPLGGLLGISRSVDPYSGNPESDPRPMIDQITELKLERVPGGAIIRATGLPPRQGYFEGALLLMNRGQPVNGMLQYQFRVVPPTGPTRTGPVQSREIIVGLFISDQTLAGIRGIQVSAARNALAVRR